MNQLGLKTKLVATCIVIALGVMALMATMWISTERVKVTGPLYQDIVRGKDLVAAHSPAASVHRRIVPGGTPGHRAEQRLTTPVPPGAHEEAPWRVRGSPCLLEQGAPGRTPEGSPREVLQACARVLRHGRRGVLRRSGGERSCPGTEAFERDPHACRRRAHRAQIDEVVTLSNTANAATEEGATATLQNTSLVIVVMSLLIFGVVVGIFFVLTRNLTGQLGGDPLEVVSITRRVADGDLSMEDRRVRQT